MQSPEFDMEAQQTRREGQTRQESRPGREANVKTGFLLETTQWQLRSGGREERA